MMDGDVVWETKETQWLEDKLMRIFESEIKHPAFMGTHSEAHVASLNKSVLESNGNLISKMHTLYKESGCNSGVPVPSLRKVLTAIGTANESTWRLGPELGSWVEKNIKQVRSLHRAYTQTVRNVTSKLNQRKDEQKDKVSPEKVFRESSGLGIVLKLMVKEGFKHATLTEPGEGEPEQDERGQHELGKEEPGKEEPGKEKIGRKAGSENGYVYGVNWQTLTAWRKKANGRKRGPTETVALVAETDPEKDDEEVIVQWTHGDPWAVPRVTNAELRNLIRASSGATTAKNTVWEGVTKDGSKVRVAYVNRSGEVDNITLWQTEDGPAKAICCLKLTHDLFSSVEAEQWMVEQAKKYVNGELDKQGLYLAKQEFIAKYAEEERQEKKQKTEATAKAAAKGKPKKGCQKKPARNCDDLSEGISDADEEPEKKKLGQEMPASSGKQEPQEKPTGSGTRPDDDDSIPPLPHVPMTMAGQPWWEYIMANDPLA